jgi:hypothetical protein
MVMNPVGLGTINNSAGEDQQHFNSQEDRHDVPCKDWTDRRFLYI